MRILNKILIISVFSIYVLIFGRSLSEEITYSPVWVDDIDTSEIGGFYSDSSIPFLLDNKIAYVSSSGKTIYSEDLLYGASIDNHGFINYSRQNKVLVVKGNKGQFLNAVDQPGYPFFSGGRRFIISYDNNSVSEFNLSGDILWKKTYGSTLSSVSASESLVFISNTNGEIQVLGKSGKNLFSKQIKSSRINIVYGGAVSENGEYMITVAGIDPQLISIWKDSGSNYSIDQTWTLSSEIRRNSLTGFSPDGLFAYIESEHEFFIIDLKKMKLYSKPLSGRIQYINFPGSSGLVQILGRNKEGYYLTVLEKDLNPLFYTLIKADDCALKIYDNKLLLGINHKIIAYNMEAM